MSERTILHSDLNCFFASVECMLDPSLKGKPMAVCGSADNRHGIVLAKSEEAKKCGVTTGEVIWQAKQKCPGLIISGAHYDQYVKYSQMVREIYSSMTDRIEPFGIDEAWLDLTLSHTPEEGKEEAEKLRHSIKSELGLTVSVGVSFNKVFAKLCSDLKKPDAVTFVPKKDFQKRLWGLPASDLLFVGKATAHKLASSGILTIGDLAKTPDSFLFYLLGKSGPVLGKYARGEDDSEVAKEGWKAPIKSIGHGTTSVHDVYTEDRIAVFFRDLSLVVGRRLREEHFLARRIQITVKDNTLAAWEFQTLLPQPTQTASELAGAAFHLFQKVYDLKTRLPIRMLAIRAIDLIPENSSFQTDLFSNQDQRERYLKSEIAADELRQRFGDRILFPGSLMGTEKWLSGKIPKTTPSILFQEDT